MRGKPGRLVTQPKRARLLVACPAGRPATPYGLLVTYPIRLKNSALGLRVSKSISTK